MPVPDFNHNATLPPHLGSPALFTDLSPYPVTSVEVCQKLGTTPERRKILSGWLAMREALRKIGFTDGFQWLDGSFMEDSEAYLGRPPGDIDVITFSKIPAFPIPLKPGSPEALLSDRPATKTRFQVDHVYVNLGWAASVIIEHTRYWYGLFSHRRSDGVWKGMLRVELNSANADQQATKILAAAAKSPKP